MTNMKLKEYIKSSGLTYAAFANKVGTNKMNVSRWARGVVNPTGDFYHKIYKVTDGLVTPNDFHGIK